MYNIDINLQYLLILIAIVIFIFTIFPHISSQKEKFIGGNIAANINRAVCGGCTNAFGVCCPRGCTWYRTCK